MKEKIKNIADKFTLVTKNIVIIAIIVYILFGIGKSIWQNYQTNQKIDSIKSKIDTIQKEVDLQKNLILYYQTVSYKELAAKLNLNYLKPGENVLIIPELSNKKITIEDITSQSITQNNVSPTPNFVKWWQYVIGK